MNCSDVPNQNQVPDLAGPEYDYAEVKAVEPSSPEIFEDEDEDDGGVPLV